MTLRPLSLIPPAEHAQQRDCNEYPINEFKMKFSQPYHLLKLIYTQFKVND